jgi:hypothetical protein
MSAGEAPRATPPGTKGNASKDRIVGCPNPC